MKFAMRHETTQRLLSRSNVSSWTLVGFFFHDRGSETQKSLSTMLQELLYQTLYRHPSLGVYVQGFYDKLVKDQGTTLPDWDVETLRMALLGIMKQQKYTIRICYFVDALDEHAGDNDQLATLLYDMTSSVDRKHMKIKICLASRPWNVFITHFGRCPGFAIHEYTRDDISIYSSTRLHQSLDGQGVRKLDKGTSLLLQRLADQITKRAHGVFIWVRLVVDDLAPNIRDGTPFSSLEDKLSKLPPELGDLYLHTLRKVDKDYSKETHAMLQIVLCSAQPLSLECVIGCAFYATLGDRYVPDTPEAMIRSLQSRSGGLLEAVPARPSTPQGNAGKPDAPTEAIAPATFIQDLTSTSSTSLTGGPSKAESTKSFTSTSDADSTNATSRTMKRFGAQRDSISTTSTNLSLKVVIGFPDRHSHLVVQFIHQTAKEFMSDYRPDMAQHKDPDWFKLPGQFFLLRSCGLHQNRWAESIRENVFIYANQIDDSDVPGPDGWPLSACWIRDVFKQMLAGGMTSLKWCLETSLSLPDTEHWYKNLMYAFSGSTVKERGFSVCLGIAANLCNYVNVTVTHWRQSLTSGDEVVPTTLQLFQRLAVFGPKFVPGHEERESIAKLLLGHPWSHSLNDERDPLWFRDLFEGTMLGRLLADGSGPFRPVISSENERLVLARILLTNGADVECDLPRTRRRPLLQSVRYGEGEMVRLLLQHGASPLATETRYSPLSTVDETGYPIEMESNICPANTDVIVSPRERGIPTLPWVYALLRRDCGVLQALNEYGGSLRIRDDDSSSLSDAIIGAGALAVALCGPGSSSRKAQ